MRIAGPRVALALAAPLLVLALGGCDSLNQVSEGLDKAEACTKALSAAGYSPDPSKGQQAVDEAQRKADELRKLAEQVSDANLQQQLRETADQMGQLQLSDLDPSKLMSWTNERLQRVDRLTRACS
ncbi:hypothetical protein GCM10012275_32860 [Longimycelium tulufanense]|uniref:Uncharacterized protein n=1 Tax=Longimycelium tulufanense TaxID=907463 RepID=A0A8J3CDP4_9PSEU|nr:bacteriophage spanin2 family protein [Longimycelium tulufanense]GGM59113.1 hypothetical protein GCM10012275_32860 [Longimycelium tulufanense]